MKQNNIPETSVFFVLFNNGDTHYFAVKKNKEIFNIYWTDFIKAYGYEGNSILSLANSIEFTKNNFVLKGKQNEIICSLEDYNKKVNSNDLTLPEIEKVYIDPELRQELLIRGQLKYDEEASRIPGILYEPLKEKLEIPNDELFKENYDDEAYEEEYDEENTYTRSLVRR